MSEEPIEYVKVNTLKPRVRNLSLIVKVAGVGKPRTIFSRRDQAEHRVAEALVGDDTGCVLLNLWDDQIGVFGKGDVFEIRNGYTSLFRGFLRLNIGRRGTAEKVDREIEEVNTENNLSEKRHETTWYRPTRRPFRRRRRRY